MSSSLYISIPCTFDGKTLIIKGLDLQGKGDSPDQALLECIKNTNLYSPLMLSKFKSFTDFRGRDFRALEVPFDSAIMDKINEVEPTPETKKKIKRSNHLIEASPEEIIKLGY